jgi:hypothetical protein
MNNTPIATVNTKHHHELDSINNVTNKTALAIIATSMFGTAALTFPFIIMQLRSPLPYMSTPKKKVLAALEEISKRKYSCSNHDDKNYTLFLSHKSYYYNNDNNNNNYINNNNKNPLRFYDLGSGDGETVLAAGSAGWNATGIELNSTEFARIVAVTPGSWCGISGQTIKIAMCDMDHLDDTIGIPGNNTTFRNVLDYVDDTDKSLVALIVLDSQNFLLEKW